MRLPRAQIHQHGQRDGALEMQVQLGFGQAADEGLDIGMGGRANPLFSAPGRIGQRWIAA